MAILKDYKCDNCNHEFEVRINSNAENPKCPKCSSTTHWLPKPNINGHTVSYALRVKCDGFSNKVHYGVN